MTAEKRISIPLPSGNRHPPGVPGSEPVEDAAQDRSRRRVERFVAVATLVGYVATRTATNAVAVTFSTARGSGRPRPPRCDGVAVAHGWNGLRSGSPLRARPRVTRPQPVERILFLGSATGMARTRPAAGGSYYHRHRHPRWRCPVTTLRRWDVRRRRSPPGSSGDPRPGRHRDARPSDRRRVTPVSSGPLVATAERLLSVLPGCFRLLPTPTRQSIPDGETTDGTRCVCLILPAVRTGKYSPPRGDEYSRNVTADSIGAVGPGGRAPLPAAAT